MRASRFFTVKTARTCSTQGFIMYKTKVLSSLTLERTQQMTMVGRLATLN